MVFLMLFLCYALLYLVLLFQTYSDKSLFGGVPSRRAVMHMTNEIILPLQRRLISFPKMKSDVIARNGKLLGHRLPYSIQLQRLAVL